MEGSSSQYWTWMKRKQILTPYLQAPIGLGGGNSNSYNNSSWEERAFAEDAARILAVGGSIWPPRSYSCNFCKREFRSAQALGGHMNIHRRDRARLKQNLSPHNNEVLNRHHHHKNDFKSSSLGNHFSSPAATTITTRKSLLPPYSSSSIIWGQKMGSTNYEGVVVNAKEENFKDLGETRLSVGLTSMFGGKKSTYFPCGDDKAIISCKKRLKTSTNISSLPVFLKPCNSNDSFVALQPGMEDLDLELRLGKQQKVK